MQAPTTDLTEEGAPEAPSSGAPSRRRRATAARRRRSPYRPWIVAGLIVALLVAALVPAGLYARGIYNQGRAVQARLTAEVSAAQTDLTHAKSLLGQATSNRNPDQIAASRAANASARTHFKAAMEMANTDPLLRQAMGYPYARDYVGPRVKAVDALCAMGLAISDTIEDASVIDAQLIAPDQGGGSGGAKLIALLKQSQPQLDKLKADLERARVQLRAVPMGVLTGSQKASLDTARDTIDKGLAGVTELEQMEPALFEILGANGARTYLVEQVNPAELRAGGGFIGSYALIQTNGGNIKELKSAGIESIDSYRPTIGQRGYVAPPATLKEFLGRDGWYLGDSNFFPDFPSNAKAAENFAQSELNTKVDGVISLDPTAVSYLLAVTGPIGIQGYGVTVQSSDFVDWLFAFENGPNRAAGRKTFLGVVADALLNKITNLPAAGWPALVAAMNKAGQERHFQTYFNNDAAEQLVTKYVWANDLNPGKAPDFIAENESNFGGTKANQYVRRTYDLTLAREGSTLHHHLVDSITVDVTHASVYPQDWYNYRAYVRLYVAGNATNLKINPVKADDFPNTPPAGYQLMDGWLQVNVPRTTKTGNWTLTMSWDTPWTADATGKETLYWQKQPGTGADAMNVSWQSGGTTFKASDKLLEDRLVTFGPDGVTIKPANSAGAQLPSISL